MYVQKNNEERDFKMEKLRKDKDGKLRKRPTQNERTENQWNKVGYKVNEGANGFWFYYWEYFNQEQVTQMTEEEFKSYKQEKRRLAQERKKAREEEDRRMLEAEARRIEQKKQEHLEAVEQKKNQMEKDGTRLIKVYIDGEGHYVYEAPDDVKIFDSVLVRFGKEGYIRPGEVTAIVQVNEICNEWWFPKRLRKIISHTSYDF